MATKIRSERRWSPSLLQSLATDISQSFPGLKNVKAEWVLSTLDGHHIFNTKIMLDKPTSLTSLCETMIAMSDVEFNSADECEEDSSMIGVEVSVSKVGVCACVCV